MPAPTLICPGNPHSILVRALTGDEHEIARLKSNEEKEGTGQPNDAGNLGPCGPSRVHIIQSSNTVTIAVL